MTRTAEVKQTLSDLIQKISSVSWLFSKDPERDFIRTRKLPFDQMIKTILCMGGKSLTNELLTQFGCRADIASASAFVQQRSKILPEAFETLFQMFVAATNGHALYEGYRLLAVDGSDIQITTNESSPDSYFPGSNGQKPYNLLHLNAMYDLLLKTYVDASVVGKRANNECLALAAMVDRASSVKPAIIIADRGYESYNVMAHIQEKGWKFLIRVKDPGSKGIASGLDLPKQEEFDCYVPIHLMRRQTKLMKQLCKDCNSYKFIPQNVSFDYLPARNRGLFHLPFRIVRFQITNNTYETVVTNLDTEQFPPAKLKELYAMRWGIETSFRYLKYTIGLLHFHAKKAEYILQEVFASLIMYNFTELITSHVVTQKANRKYAFQANFSAAVHICRDFFLKNVAPLDVEALIARNLSPVRPGRRRPRKATARKAVSFIYRVA